MTVEAEVPLAGGDRAAVTRRGDVVLRDAGPWTPAVHALLAHLEQAGFDGSPRLVDGGIDEDGREKLRFVPGDVINPRPWSDEAIHALGALLRRLHDATASFRPPPEATWRPWFGRGVGAPDIIGHCDPAPWNVVSRDGSPVALIDWEAAGPVDRLTEVAMAAWSNAQLYDDVVAELNGLADAATRIRQVRHFADGYALSSVERGALAERMIDFAAQSAANEVAEQAITPETVHAPRVWGIAWQTASVAWMIRHRSALKAVLA